MTAWETDLDVTCWCEEAIKPMAPADIRNGIGWTCGRHDCTSESRRRTCEGPGCDNELPAQSTGAPRRFCSHRCTQRAAYHRKRNR